MRRACLLLLLLLLPLLSGCMMMDEAFYGDEGGSWNDPGNSSPQGYNSAMNRCGGAARPVATQTREPDLAVPPR